MTTFGHKIAAVCDDGTVGIYDSITGVLRLSLSLTNPVQTIKGSPDGSVLFCAHKTPSITMWDIQTGGLIHTFDLECNAEDIAISSKGRYLACGLSDESVEVWEVASKMEGGPDIWIGSPITSFCWLEPEEQLVVSTGTLVRVWNLVAGTVLQTFPIRYPANHMAYSQKFNQLAIMSRPTPESTITITITNPQTGISTTPHQFHQPLSCFAFSQTTEGLVCGMETHGLQLFDISTQRLKHIDHPDTMTSVSSLQNGTVVANFAGSGIQLLSLDGGHASSQQPTISVLAMDTFDEDRIIAIFPTTRDHIALLETATMSQLLKIPVQDTGPAPTNHTTILCASHGNLVAVRYFEEGHRGFLQSWRFHMGVPRWTVEVDGVPEICRISPTAVQLVTLHTADCLGRVCVWNAQNGHLDAWLDRFSLTHPLDLEFTSDTDLRLHYDTFRLFYIVSPEGLIFHGKEAGPLLPKQSQKRWCLHVDDAHEWVVNDSKRICWIPPGYIGSIQPSYCLYGSSLVMVGQDRMLRRLTF